MSWKFNRTPIYVKNNFAKLNVYFEALNYARAQKILPIFSSDRKKNIVLISFFNFELFSETIEQKRAYEVPGLLGDIGGQMGLFIGASILTILELFDYVYEVIKVIFVSVKVCLIVFDV